MGLDAVERTKKRYFMDVVPGLIQNPSDYKALVSCMPGQARHDGVETKISGN